MPGRERGDSLFYSFDLGPMHVMVYNTGEAGRGSRRLAAAGLPAYLLAGLPGSCNDRPLPCKPSSPLGATPWCCRSA